MPTYSFTLHSYSCGKIELQIWDSNKQQATELEISAEDFAKLLESDLFKSFVHVVKAEIQEHE